MLFLYFWKGLIADIKYLERFQRNLRKTHTEKGFDHLRFWRRKIVLLIHANKST